MPRLLALVAIFVVGCSFSADYGGGTYACFDGRCPAGQVCVENACVVPDDGGPVDAIDAPDIDARIPAFTCADPGILPSAGGSAEGDTSTRMALVSSLCGGFVMNGKDAVYRIDLEASDRILISVTGRRAYVIRQCTTPAPACFGNVFAAEGVPIQLMPGAGPAFIVVDDEVAASAGPYTLTVTQN